jgi:N-acetylglucosamine kinase-like BadF-type ATPase
MTYLVGIDSGGTHTNIRLLTPDGEQKTISEIDKSLSSTRSNSELRAVFNDIFSAIHGHTLGRPTCAWINSAGFSAASRRRFEDLLTEAIKDLDICVGLSNDAIGIMLAHESEVVTIIAGTGSVAMARTPAGDVITRGGDEWVASDYGSAYWLGLVGIRVAYSALEGGPETALLKCLVERFSPLHDGAERATREVVQEISRRLASLGTDTKPTIASFAPQVTRQAELGDDEAQKIVRKAADDLASASSRVYREIAAQAEGRVVIPRFLISGSVAYRSPFYFETLKASLDQFLFDVRESIDHPVELTHQLNGLDEALVLAKRLADGGKIASLDDQHPFSVCGELPPSDS